MSDTTDDLRPEGPENLWTPDLDDRRRIAEQAVLMHLEREGSILSGPWGQIVLNHALSQDEVIPLSDALNKSISKRMMRGMI